MVSREVDVNRPEHSWIPFYQELAEKLVKDRWRDRQGELVAMLGEMDAGDGLLPSFKDDLESDMDPFTIIASFSRDPRNFDWEKSTRIMRWHKSRFSVSSEIPSKPSFIPYANNQQVQYFSFHTPHSIKDDVSNLWDLFEEAVIADTFQAESNNERLTDLITRCLRVRGIAISKLTSALYWINPHHFLHSDTVNAVGGADLGIKANDTDSYLKCLVRTAELTERSFPETNIAVFKSENPDWGPPRIWVVRAGGDGQLSREFRTGGYVGFNFGLDDDNLSQISSKEEAEQRFRARRADGNETAPRQISEFLLTMKIGDYVLMPDRDGKIVHYGTVASDPYFGLEGTHRNRRQIEWNDSQSLTREALGWRGRAYGATVNLVQGSMRDRFLAVIKDDTVVVVPAPVRTIYRMPEDSWVPFHLEVAEKLMEGEWWLPEKREALDDMIEKVRWSDPDEVSDDYEHIQWTPDPYSFYLSFNMRTDGTKRLPGYRMVQELLDVGANVPDADHRARGLGTHYRFTNPPGDDDIDALWDFFRFVTRFDPAEDEESAEFVEKYDRVIEVNGFIGQWDITLSYWLYWIDPRKYLLTRRLHRQELGLAAELGLPENINGGQQYLQALRTTRSFAESKRKSLLDINRESTTREMLGLNGDIDHEGDIEDERIAYTIDDMVNDDDLFFEPGELRRMHSRFEDKKNLILQGPPGLGRRSC